MTETLDRATTPLLRRRLETFPVVVVTGARQTGKSTVARALGSPERLYLSLDDPEILALATERPRELLARADRLTIDEVQRAPDLLLSVKMDVDASRAPGRFLLTGSANLLLMQRVADSLAGRAVYLTLWPLTRREKLGLGACGLWATLFEHDPTHWPTALPADPVPGEPWQRLATEGGYPVPGFHLRTDPSDAADWFDGYVQTYLERDLRDLAAIQDLPGFQRLMRAAALRVGGILNLSDLARDVSVANTTAQRYLDLLVTSYQVVLLPSYSANRTKQLVKRPKIYWNDPGLALHLGGETAPRGAHLENLILQDLLVWKELQPGLPQVLYWRTAKDAEVDFVIEWRGRLLPIEVKAARTVSYGDTKSLRTFLEEYPDMADAGVVLYDGTETTWVAKGVLAVPWGRVV